MKYTQSQYEEAVDDQGLIDDLNERIFSLIITAHKELGGHSFELTDDLECQIYDLISMVFNERLSEMRKILENGNPLYQSVKYINEHGGSYDC